MTKYPREPVAHYPIDRPNRANHLLKLVTRGESFFSRLGNLVDKWV